MYMYKMYFYLYPLYFVINLLCKSYQGTRKIMQKNQKEKEKKHFKNTSHGAYIVNNRLYI